MNDFNRRTNLKKQIKDIDCDGPNTVVMGEVGTLELSEDITEIPFKV